MAHHDDSPPIDEPIAGADRLPHATLVFTTAEHADALHACIDAVAREAQYLAVVRAPPIENLRHFLRTNAEMGGVSIVAVEGAAVLGWCEARPGWAPTLRHRATIFMGVLDEYRGLGLGTKLLSACIDAAGRLGTTRLDLEVRVDNERARRLYERCGFEVEARLERAMRFDGRYVDTFKMRRLLDVAPTGHAPSASVLA